MRIYASFQSEQKKVLRSQDHKNRINFTQKKFLILQKKCNFTEKSVNFTGKNANKTVKCLCGPNKSS